MKRLISLLILAFSITVIGLLLIAPLTVLAQGDGHGEDDQGGEGDTGGEHGADGAEVAALRGAAVFAEFCQACHGPHGESIGSGPAFAALELREELAHDIITAGADHDADDGVAMPAYGDVLSDEQLNDVLAYMATWESGETPPLPEPHLTLHVDHVPDYFGDAHAGAVIYAKSCAGCHGAEGQGRGEDQFPKLKFDARTTRTIAAEGAESVYMPGFGVDAGGPLSDTQLDDLETYLASWALEEDDASDNNSGIAVMIVVTGIVTLAAVGVIYLVRTVPEDAVDQDIFPDRQ
ncbi:MAG: c-type cytochrome [Anaerolineae bacterium]|nr:c-type cytochrome [Anaerolineae bacterium]